MTHKRDLEVPGFEPGSSRMQSERSTTELHPHMFGPHLFITLHISHNPSTCTYPPTNIHTHTHASIHTSLNQSVINQQSLNFPDTQPPTLHQSLIHQIYRSLQHSHAHTHARMHTQHKQTQTNHSQQSSKTHTLTTVQRLTVHQIQPINTVKQQRAIVAYQASVFANNQPCCLIHSLAHSITYLLTY